MKPDDAAGEQLRRNRGIPLLVEAIVHYLYGIKKDVARRLVATFGSEQQLLAYVRWATLSGASDKAAKFEQGSALAGYAGWESSEDLLTDDDETSVIHNPTPSML